MCYYPLEASSFWVEVVVRKVAGQIEMAKCRGEEPVRQRPVRDFRKVMIHTKIVGPRMKSWPTNGDEITRTDSSFSFLHLPTNTIPAKVTTVLFL